MGVFRDREELEKQVIGSVSKLLDDALDHVVVGTARVLLSLNLRSPALFGRSRDARENADARWIRLMRAEPSLGVRLWCHFARESGRAILRRVAAGDSIKAGAIASAILRALSPESSFDDLVDIDGTLISDESIRSYLSNPPASVTSTARLSALIVARETPDDARTAALDELHRRREFSDDVVDYLLSPENSFNFGSVVNEAEMRVIAVFEATAVMASLDRLLASGDSRTVLSRVRRWRVALTALPAVASDAARTVGRKFGGTEPELLFALGAKDPALRLDAIAVLERQASPLSAFLDGQDLSAYPDLVTYFSDSITYMAVQYLSTLDGFKIGRRESDALIQIIERDNLVSDDARDLLTQIGSARDADVVVGTRRRRYEQIGDRLTSKLTLAQLSDWLGSDDALRVNAALLELSRRDHDAPRRLTRMLMRHSDADVRMAATSHLLRGADRDKVEEERTRYVSGGATYFYNVTCEFDRELAKLPAY